jgi:hypothetical protein
MRATIKVFLGEDPRLLGLIRYNAEGARENASFEYDASWLSASDRFSIDPALQLVAGAQFHKKSREGSGFHAAIADTEPDGWGRRVILRGHAKRMQEARRAGSKVDSGPLNRLDFLLEVDDASRAGALRFQDEEGVFRRASEEGRSTAPPLIELAHIAAATRSFETNTESHFHPCANAPDRVVDDDGGGERRGKPRRSFFVVRDGGAQRAAGDSLSQHAAGRGAETVYSAANRHGRAVSRTSPEGERLVRPAPRSPRRSLRSRSRRRLLRDRLRCSLLHRLLLRCGFRRRPRPGALRRRGQQIDDGNEDVFSVPSAEGLPVGPEMVDQDLQFDLFATQSPLPFISSNKEKDAAPSVRRLHVLPEELTLEDLLERSRRVVAQRFDLDRNVPDSCGEGRDVDLLVVIDHVLPDDRIEATSTLTKTGCYPELDLSLLRRLLVLAPRLEQLSVAEVIVCNEVVNVKQLGLHELEEFIQAPRQLFVGSFQSKDVFLGPSRDGCFHCRLMLSLEQAVNDGLNERQLGIRVHLEQDGPRLWSRM